MQILGLFGMYFNCFVVEIEKSLIFSQIGYGHTVHYAIIVPRLIIFHR